MKRREVGYRAKPAHPSESTTPLHADLHVGWPLGPPGRFSRDPYLGQNQFTLSA